MAGWFDYDCWTIQCDFYWPWAALSKQTGKAKGNAFILAWLRGFLELKMKNNQSKNATS